MTGDAVMWPVLGLAVLEGGAALLANVAWREYGDARLGCRVRSPRQLLPQADAGEGQRFVSRGGELELLVYGARNEPRRDLRQALRDAHGAARLAGLTCAPLAELGGNAFVLTWREGERVCLRKTVLEANVFKTLEVRYPARRRGCGALARRIARTFPHGVRAY